MNLELRKTKDGSHTLHHPGLNEQYHSIHGAIRESRTVFLGAGLQPLLPSPNILRLLEVGFGTGLNALLTFFKCVDEQQSVEYVTLEPNPLPLSLIRQLNYPEEFEEPRSEQVFHKLHECEWEQKHRLSDNFTFQKLQMRLQDFQSSAPFHLIYFDAFAPNKQPEMWTKEIFEKIYQLLGTEGILVTYSAKGDVKRGLQSVRFSVETLPGPPGKREMTRARKG